jgi:hypothetical protein
MISNASAHLQFARPPLALSWFAEPRGDRRRRLRGGWA